METLCFKKPLRLKPLLLPLLRLAFRVRALGKLDLKDCNLPLGAVGVGYFDGGGQVGGGRGRVEETAGGVWNAGHF